MINKILNRLFYNPYKYVKRNASIVSCVDSTILNKNVKFDIRTKGKGLRVDIGCNNNLSCQFILESDKGFISIGDKCFINGGTQIISRSSVVIGNYVTIAWGVTIYDHDSHSLSFLERRKDVEQQLLDSKTGNLIKNKNWGTVSSKPISIENDAWIGMGAVILKGVIIGRGAIVAARAVVTKNVEPFTVVAGNPAVFVKRL